MTLEDILSLWEKDSVIDTSELGLASLTIPQLHHKYYKIFMQEKLTKSQLSAKYKKMLKIKTEYYLGKTSEDDLKAYNWEPFRLRVLKSDLDMYLDADKDMSELTFSIDVANTKIDFLESILKTVANRTFQVKNAIDWERFKVGS